MVREDKARLERAAPPEAPDLHPPRGEGASGRGEPLHRGAFRRGGWGEDERPAQVLRRLGPGEPPGRRKPHTAFAVDRRRRLERSMEKHGTGIRREGGEDPLGLAERVSEEQARPVLAGVLAPPGEQIGEDRGGIGPAEDRQGEGRLEHETVAAHGFVGKAGGIGCGLDIPRDHPDLPGVFQAYLGRSPDVARGMKGETHPVQDETFTPGELLHGDRLPEAEAQQAGGFRSRQVASAAGPGVVGVGVADDRARHRPSRVDVAAGGCAEQPACRRLQPGRENHMENGKRCVSIGARGGRSLV